MSEPEKPWWKTTTGMPAWATVDKHWHGWAFASLTLLLFAVVLVVSPENPIEGPMVVASVTALAQAIRVRNGGKQ